MKFIKLMFLILIVSLSACSKHDSNSSHNDVPDKKDQNSDNGGKDNISKAIISDLTLLGKVSAGSTLTLKIDCSECDLNKSTVSWWVDRNNDGKFSNSERAETSGVSYLLTEGDVAHDIQISALGIDLDGIKMKAPFVKVFSIRSVENVEMFSGKLLVISRSNAPKQPLLINVEPNAGNYDQYLRVTENKINHFYGKDWALIIKADSQKIYFDGQIQDSVELKHLVRKKEFQLIKVRELNEENILRVDIVYNDGVFESFDYSLIEDKVIESEYNFVLKPHDAYRNVKDIVVSKQDSKMKYIIVLQKNGKVYRDIIVADQSQNDKYHRIAEQHYNSLYLNDAGFITGLYSENGCVYALNDKGKLTQVVSDCGAAEDYIKFSDAKKSNDVFVEKMLTSDDISLVLTNRHLLVWGKQSYVDQLISVSDVNSVEDFWVNRYGMIALMLKTGKLVVVNLKGDDNFSEIKGSIKDVRSVFPFYDGFLVLDKSFQAIPFGVSIHSTGMLDALNTWLSELMPIMVGKL